MMFSSVKTCSLLAMDGIEIQVETVITTGIPYFSVVGLPDPVVQESKERIRSAFASCEMDLPSKRITINLAPSYQRKDCSGFDLPIAISILISTGMIPVSALLSESLIIGELSLNGELRSIPGSLLMTQFARKWGLKRVLLPFEDAAQASYVPGIQVIGIRHLSEAIDYLCGRITIPPARQRFFTMNHDTAPGILPLLGQPLALRALSISAAGFHPLLLWGPPGTGKTTAANALISILPGPDQEESLEIASIYNCLGLPIPSGRPFRNPHHTISAPALVGGGNVIRPGEITLAHRGVLFMDELAEFRSSALETFRQPLETHSIVINRLHHTVCLPAHFLFVASMNPCPCGYYPDRSRCACSPSKIRQYLKRIRGPLLDRIDLSIYLSVPDFQSVKENHFQESDTLALQERVKNAILIQRKRYQNETISYNSELTSVMLPVYCALDAESEHFMERAYEHYHLSVRGYHRVLKVARTIADLEEEASVRLPHLQEAIQLRSVDALETI